MLPGSLPCGGDFSSCLSSTISRASPKSATTTVLFCHEGRNVLCVSSSKRINSFMTITSPVSLWVTYKMQKN
ncbi:hypothetical protein EYF80_054709 [Liparis tanakae]|uniref:Uncharacterized protein n=1 Tax=Liparis tanakae TaxID=230148 RepID=A0A4Z2F1P1_9TELE|nr:hypothetical protein EYF80_054709 [Liparis tanakae]